MADDFNITECSEESSNLVASVNYIRTASALASTITCIVALILLLKYMCRRATRLWNTFSHRLIVSFLMAALLYSFSTCFQWVRLLHDYSNPHALRACEAVGFFVQYFSWTLILMTSVLIFHLFNMLYKCCSRFDYSQKIDKLGSDRFRVQNSSEHFKLIVYILISFGLPLLFVWIPFLPEIKGYGPSGYWCWIMICDQNGNRYITGYIEQALFWYLSIIVVMGIIIVFIIAVVYHLRNMRSKLKIACPLIMFPLIFFFVNMIAILNRVVTLVLSRPVTALAILHGFIDPLWGIFASAVVFVYICIVECDSGNANRNNQDYRRPTVYDDSSSDRELDERHLTNKEHNEERDEHV